MNSFAMHMWGLAFESSADCQWQRVPQNFETSLRACADTVVHIKKQGEAAKKGG